MLLLVHLHVRGRTSVEQVARQEGEYLAKLLKKHNPPPHTQGEGALPRPEKAFKYTHLGSLAYVGADKAVMDIPKMGPITGWTAGQLFCISQSSVIAHMCLYNVLQHWVVVHLRICDT